MAIGARVEVLATTDARVVSNDERTKRALEPIDSKHHIPLATTGRSIFEEALVYSFEGEAGPVW